MNLKSRLNEEITAGVHELLNQFMLTWNKKDLNGFGNLFTTDAEFTDVVGQTAIGKEAIVKQHVFPFENVMKLAQFEMKNAYIRELTPELIIVSALWKVTGSITPDGKPLPDRNGVLQLIIEKNDSSLLIKLVHNSDNALPYEKQEQFIH